MKAYEHRQMGSEELHIKLGEAKEEFFNLRFQNATGQLENFSQLKAAKREIARLNTILRERDLGIEVEAKPGRPSRSERWRARAEAEDAKASARSDDSDSEDETEDVIEDVIEEEEEDGGET
jgi:large subunit ribosomal protein L29